jgi:hypothetical protein
MIIGVIGSRTFIDYDLMVDTLKHIKITKIVSGGARGSDSLAERYAKEHNIPTQIFLPDWEKNGKSAGFKRNTDIVNESDMIVAFWDETSKGTLDSIKKAEKLNKKILIINIKK